jgi:haloalkane dehalogenase
MGALFKWLFGIILVGIAALAGFAFYLTTLNADPVQKPERQMSEVWANYPFKSHYISVNGSSMHYIDEGDPDGPVFLFLHGNPTSSYLWRNVLSPVAASGARVIAVDNIGFGASDRPDIDYTFAEHAEYINGFIEAMDLKDVTLVIHDWGSALGFDYAFRHQENVKGIVFMEAILRVPSLADLDPLPRRLFKLFRTQGIGELMVMGGNFFVEKVIPLSVVREMTDEEMDAYREPFPTFGSRLPTLVWPREIPFDGQPEDVAARIAPFAQWLPTSSTPKLMFYFEPGALVSKGQAEAMARDWTNMEAQFLGDGIHFVQEDHGSEIGAAIVEWSKTTFPDPASPATSDEPPLSVEN